MPVYRKAHANKPAKRSRTRPVYGRGEDAGRYFRCWNCGFVCDSKRDALGGSDSAGGDNHKDFALQTGSNYRAGIGPRNIGTLDVRLHYQVAIRIDANTDADAVYHHHKTNITSGCPFCGSTNWRGDY